MSHRWCSVGRRGSLRSHLIRKTSLDPNKGDKQKGSVANAREPEVDTDSALRSGWQCWAQSQGTWAPSRNAHFQPRHRGQCRALPSVDCTSKTWQGCAEDRLRLSGVFQIGLSWSKHRAHKGSGSREKLEASRQRAQLWMFLSASTSLPSEAFRESKQISWVNNSQDKTQVFLKSKNSNSVS